MAILTMFEIHGDPDEIVAAQEAVIVPQARRLAAENGGLSQTIVKTDSGVMVLNLWESEDGMRAVAQQISPIAEQAGMEQVGWRRHEVLRHYTHNDEAAS